MTETFNRAFPEAEVAAPFDPGIAVRFAFTLLSGAALNQVLAGPDATDPPESVVSLKLLAGLIVNSPWRTPS